LGECLHLALFSKNSKVPQVFVELLFLGKSFVLIVTKMGWATFGAIFPQTTYLVSLGSML
jgi:hypothetical protein